MKITGFADEISPSLEEQLSVLKGEGIRYLEFRSAWNTNVLKLSDDELSIVKRELERSGIRVSAIGSPIGKITILDDFEEHLAVLEKAIFVAKLFGAPYVRIFSFFLPEGDIPSKHRDEVMRRMSRIVRRAEEEDLIFLLENEKGIYGETPERCLDVLEACASPNFRQAFDPGNFVQSGVTSIMEAYRILEDYVDYVHIKDVTAHNGKETPAGQGDGQLPELLKQLQNTGYDGFLSLEPHLVYAGIYPGQTPQELFKAASQALKNILRTIGVKWD